MSEKKVLSALRKGPKSLEEISYATGLPQFGPKSANAIAKQLFMQQKVTVEGKLKGNTTVAMFSLVKK